MGSDNHTAAGRCRLFTAHARTAVDVCSKTDQFVNDPHCASTAGNAVVASGDIRRAWWSSAPLHARKAVAATSIARATVRKRMPPGQNDSRPATQMPISHGSAMATNGSDTRC